MTTAATLTATVSEHVAGAMARPLDEETEHLASLHLLDTMAAIVACRDLEAARVARRYVERVGGRAADGAGVTVLGTGDRAPVVGAVFAGAMTAHAAELNDFMPAVFVQPGPAVVAAALGVGELRDRSGADVVRALVAGYDLAFRVPKAMGVGNLRRAGLATHGVGPCFGAAAAASALLGQSPDEVAQVLSLTAQQAAGSWQWLLDVEHVEKAFVFGGLGARNGVEAALLVAEGFRGVPDVMDRPGTWFTSAAFTDPDGDGDLAAMTDGLGGPAVLLATAYKRYPVGGPAQPAVEALLDLAGEGLRAEDVARVVIEMPGRWEAFRDAAMPALNLRYLGAIILLDGRLDFTAAQSLERMHEPAVAELMARVEVRHDPSQESGPGAARTESARVRIERRDGEVRERFVPHVTGFPSHPMTTDEVRAKAFELVAPHLGAAGAQAVLDACRTPAAYRAGDLARLIAR